LQLWDVCSDQEAVDLIRNIHDPQAASKQLVDHALARFSTDNLSGMVVRYDNKALKELKNSHSIGVEGDPDTIRGSVSEADAIVSSVKKLQEETGETGVEKIGANTANQMIVEEEEGQSTAAEPGPELNTEAVDKAKKNNAAS
jgi:protein phosphatase PTC1